jgi:DNA-binding CsgD family transcriptional regulator
MSLPHVRRPALFILQLVIQVGADDGGAVLTQDTQPPAGLPSSAVIELVGDRWLIGREQGCAIQVLDKHLGVSRRHATIERVEGQFTLTDHSRYGTYLNGVRLLAPYVLAPGDGIGLAEPRMHLRFDDLEEANRCELTLRELEVLHLIAGGKLNKEIADHLSIALTTVNSHLKRIYEKLGAHNRTEAVAQARRRHLI